MVTKQELIRSKLDAKLFNTNLALTTTLINKSSPVYNDRGEIDSDTETSQVVKIIPYNIMNERQSHQAFGEMNEGDMDCAFRYDITMDINDIVSIDGQGYYIKQIEKNLLPEYVVTITRLSKTQL